MRLIIWPLHAKFCKQWPPPMGFRKKKAYLGRVRIIANGVPGGAGKFGMWLVAATTAKARRREW